MKNLEKYFVGNAVMVEVDGNRRKYIGMGIVLIDLSLKDIINEGIVYKVSRGKLTDKKTQFFDLIGMKETGAYLVEATRLDSFLSTHPFPDDVVEYRDLLLSKDDISEEEVKRLFPLLVKDHFRIENSQVLKMFKK